MAEPRSTRWTHPAVILVATDVSDLDRLMPFAMDQAEQSEARLILFHSIQSSASMSIDAVGMPYYDPSGAIEVAEKALRPYCEAARQRLVDCHAIVREGPPAQQIATVAQQFSADRILLGTRSRGRLGKMLLGSVAEQVLRSVNLPVITVGPEAHLPVQSGYEERVVLHATTLRETSRPSAVLACEMAAQLKAKLVLLHVLPPVDQLIHDGERSDIEAATKRQLEAMAAETSCPSRPPIEAIVLHGNPFIEILAEAADRKASLIVLGATHRSAFQNLTRDHTVYRVLAHARCPVLTLREAQIADDTTIEHAGACRN
jgi:nucleotide-binding universal stress UspA family protein